MLISFRGTLTVLVAAAITTAVIATGGWVTAFALVATLIGACVATVFDLKSHRAGSRAL